MYSAPIPAALSKLWKSLTSITVQGTSMGGVKHSCQQSRRYTLLWEILGRSSPSLAAAAGCNKTLNTEHFVFWCLWK